MANIESVRNRLNINLTVRAADELEAITRREGLSKTDAVNRAIGLYRFVTEHLANGDQLLIKDVINATYLRVHIQ